MSARIEEPAAPGSLAPGLALCGGLALAAVLLQRATGQAALNPMVVAMLLAMAVRAAVGPAPWAAAGARFAVRALLRLAIMLLGFNIVLGDFAAVGLRGLLVCVSAVAATWVFTHWLARRLGLTGDLPRLIAAGTSICGASAVIGAGGVIGADEEDVTYAIASVTLFGTVATLAYPALQALLHLDPRLYGLWAGASIHEVGQVAAAGFAVGEEAGRTAMIAKLARVLLLAPVLIMMGLAMGRRDGGRRDGAAAEVRFPWFIVGFGLAVAVASLAPIPPPVLAANGLVTTALLSMALAGVGLEADLGRLAARGARPLLLGGLASAFIAGWCLAGASLV